MYKIIIWGTGKYANLVIKSLDFRQCKVVAFVDSDSKKWGKKFEDIDIFSVDDIDNIEYDYLLIAIKECETVVTIARQKNFKSVITYKCNSFSWYDTGLVEEYERIIPERNILKLRLDKLDLMIKNLDFEYGNKKKQMLAANDLLDKLLRDKISLTRFGDGELELMALTERALFQKKSYKLKKRLIEVFNSNEEKLEVALADNFGSLDKYTEKAQTDIRLYIESARETGLTVIDWDREYYDAYVTRPYILYKDKTYAKVIFEKWKKLWEKRNVLLIEGEYVRSGVGNDLFGDAKSVRRIICPAKNAFEKYDEILNAILDFAEKDDLILISLGPTATVLAYDVYKAGYQAIDFGQLDNEYEWFMQGALERAKINNKGVPELYMEPDDEDFVDEKYINEIVRVVK